LAALRAAMTDVALSIVTKVVDEDSFRGGRLFLYTLAGAGVGGDVKEYVDGE
jgi:hypothetical protein